MDTSSSSLHVMQELVSPLSLDASPVRTGFRKLKTTSPLPEAGFKVPPPDDREDRELSVPEKEGWRFRDRREELVVAMPSPSS